MLYADPLFKGCTRPAMIFGVPVQPMLVTAIGIGVLALIVSLWAWLLLPIFISIMRAITAKDDQAFRQLWLWWDTSGRNRNKKFWGGSSYGAFKFKK